VLDEDEFAKTLIPELFKHNNYASFVRQLNMYGFHKRVGLSDNSMKASERKNKSPSEYYNPYFKRGHPNLLWLINKAKGGSSKSLKKKVKNEDGHADVDSDDDTKDVEEVFYGNNQGSRALSTAPESGQLQRRDMALIQGQLADVRKQYGAMSQAIARLRKDYNQIYQQAVAFQTLHDRHENSLNAILTFLANVYSRSLDGQTPQNFAQMFANVIPQDQQRQNQGNVVDIGEVGNQAQQNANNASPSRRQQRLLMAPPTAGSRPGGAAPTVSTQQTQGYSNVPHSGSVEELFEGSNADSPQVKNEEQQGMMDLINNTNAQNTPSTGGVNPDILSQYEHANGNTPLSPEMRSAMLNMIANQTSVPGNNNALVSPTPPPALNLGNMAYTQAEIEDLARMNSNQGARINQIGQAVPQVPFSPTGGIGLDETSYFPGLDSEQNGANLDLDQYLEPGAFLNGSSPLGGAGGFDMDNYGEGFDLGMDGTNDAGRIVETNSSGVNTPEAEVTEEQPEYSNSPNNKRRKT
jgi:heat shock transcription factor